MKKVFASAVVRSKGSALVAIALCATGVFLAALSLVGASAEKKPSDKRQLDLKNPSVPTVGPGWSLVTSPNKVNDVIESVVCLSTSDCWGVGNWYHQVTMISQPLVQHWNGSQWSLVPAPAANTTFRSRGYLHGLACPLPTMCFAVGEYQTSAGLQQPLIEKWDGEKWSIIAANTSTTLRNFLVRVTCTSSTDCWAVGSVNTTGQIYKMQIIHWNGSAWSPVAVPSTGMTTSEGLGDVTCVSSAFCWAVGSYTDTQTHSLTVRWNGTAWSIVASPNTNPTELNGLQSVSCITASDCWAGGAYQGAHYQTLMEHWDGNAWSIVASPNISTIDEEIIYYLKCTATNDCLAVGYHVDFGTGFSQTLGLRWNGSAWTLVTVPNASQDDYLYGVACNSSSDCWGFGYFNRADGNDVLMLRWNGSAWMLASSTNIGSTGTSDSNNFVGVTCLSLKDCWAVGSYNNGGVGQTLISRWNGNSWSIVSSPNTSISQNNSLGSVACSASNDCWAAGTYQNAGGVYQTLILHWDGLAWSIVSSPNTNTGQINQLAGIACISSTNCFAVGISVNGNGFPQTLTLRWNGATWSIVPSPNSSAMQENWLLGISCVASECWAVGYYHPGSFHQVLVQKWDGVSWQISPSTNTSPSQDNILNSVSCVAASQCFAAGSSSSAGLFRTLIETWNGPSSSILPSPNSDPAQSNTLNGISCSSATNCFAVGHYFNASAVSQSLTEQWNGSAWTIVTAYTLTAANELAGVHCPTTGSCWAVGDRNGSTLPQTLIEQYAPSTPAVGTVASRLIHSISGFFDVDLPQTGPRGVEPRSGAGGAYKLVFTFPNKLTSVTSASPAGSITSSGLGPNEYQYTVNVTGVTSGSNLTVTLNGVTDAENNTGNVSGTLGVLSGDATGDGVVNSSDISLTKAKSGQVADMTNFRADPNVDGVINSSDISLVKSRSGTALP